VIAPPSRSRHADDDIVNHCMKTMGSCCMPMTKARRPRGQSTRSIARSVERGLGWYAVLIADVFDYLPADHPDDRPCDHPRQLTAGLKANQDAKSGRWCQVVDECTLSDNWTSRPAPDVSLSHKKSIDKGYIDGTQYDTVVSQRLPGSGAEGDRQ